MQLEMVIRLQILHFNNFTVSIWGSSSSPPQAFHTEFGNLGQNWDSPTNSEINLPYNVNRQWELKNGPRLFNNSNALTLWQNLKVNSLRNPHTWQAMEAAGTLGQGSLLFILRGGCLLLKYSNLQQIYKELSQFYKKKLRTGLIRLKVASDPTLPKGQKPKWHLTTNCQTDKKLQNHCFGFKNN